MPRTAEKDRVAIWQHRVDAANRAYREWEEKFQCDRCEQYWEGFQWPDDEGKEQEHYTINMIFPTVESRNPSLMFYRPNVKVRPRPARNDDPGSTLVERAKLQEDTANTFIANRDVAFRPETFQALKEAQFRFGVVEVGYTITDFVDNPNLDKPALVESEEGDEPKVMKDRDGTEIIDTRTVLIKGEGVFVRHIPAGQFRVPVKSHTQLNRCDWVGYYEDHLLEDVKQNKRYKNRSSLKATGAIKDEYTGVIDGASLGEERDKERSTVRLWKIWDLRTKERIVFPNGGEKFLLEGEKFDDHPFEALKFHDRTGKNKGFYPVPPIFNLLSPQDELNETREMQRVHRRRFYRRYTVSAQVEQKEAEKLERGGDGVYIVAEKDQIVPVQDAPLDAAVARNIPQTKEDLREISAVGSEQRGEADPNVTATQANIVEARSQLRENFQRFQVSEWLGAIVSKILRLIIKNFSLEFWITANVDPTGPAAAMEAARVMAGWKQIQASQLGAEVMDISVDVESLSPISEQQERQDFFQGLTVIANPALAPILLGSPTLLKKSLGYFGIKGGIEVEEIKRALMAMLMMQAQAAGAKGSPGVGGPQGPPAPGPTPSNSDTEDQLDAQMRGPIQ